MTLARATAVLAGATHARTRWATVRTQLINVPARVATSSRTITLHLPSGWAWADAWQHLHTQATAMLLAAGRAAPPTPAAT